MKNAKKILAVILALTLALLTFAIPAAAVATDSTETTISTKELITNKLYQLLDKLISAIVKILNFALPGLNWKDAWPTLDNYISENFYAGEDEFDYVPAESSQWEVGFAEASLLDGLDIFDGSFYMAGSLEAFSGRVPTELVDDQTVCAYAISDNNSGTVVHAVIDGFGLSRGDVNIIRAKLANFAAENNIISVNVSVLHQHSCIDTLGMAAPLLSALVKNPAVSLVSGNTDEMISGKNAKFMQNLYTVTAAVIVNAVNDMTAGELYYGTADVSEYINDKRDPQVYDANMSRLRFVPYDETENEIWICEAGIHCVGLGASSSKLSGDFPYYIKQTIKEETNADVVYVQGAELALTAKYDSVIYEDTASNSKLKALGEALAAKIMSITDEEKLLPVLNIAHKEVILDPDNQILTLAVREGLLSTVIVKDGLGYKIITEIGYMELGNTVGIFMAPGEIAAEILWGGATEASASWTGESWDYPALQETANVKNLICFGLCNDQAGYILTDNDIRSMFTENEEINAASTTSASAIANAFAELIVAVK